MPPSSAFVGCFKPVGMMAIKFSAHLPRFICLIFGFLLVAQISEASLVDEDNSLASALLYGLLGVVTLLVLVIAICLFHLMCSKSGKTIVLKAKTNDHSIRDLEDDAEANDTEMADEFAPEENSINPPETGHAGYQQIREQPLGVRDKQPVSIPSLTKSDTAFISASRAPDSIARENAEIPLREPKGTKITTLKINQNAQPPHSSRSPTKMISNATKLPSNGSSPAKRRSTTPKNPKEIPATKPRKKSPVKRASNEEWRVLSKMFKVG